MVELNEEIAKEYIDKVCCYPHYRIVGINPRTNSVIIDIEDKNGTILRKNKLITIESRERKRKSKINNLPDKSWSRQRIMEWLDARNLYYIKWLPFKFILLTHVENYKRTLNVV